MPKISVIVPVYKVEPYLHRCVDSIINQTYQNLEIILVEDGSPDNCPQICDEYAQKDNRIKVIHQENAGVSAARNAGLEIARGDYIAFVDSDDFIDSKMYEEMLYMSQRYHADIIECNYQYGSWKNNNSGEIFVYSGSLAANKLFSSPRFYDGLSVSPCNKLFTKRLLADIRFLPGCSYAEDM